MSEDLESENVNEVIKPDLMSLFDEMTFILIEKIERKA